MSQAATLLPGDLAGGVYSSSVAAPTVVGPAYSQVNGSATGATLQTFVITGLAQGAQDIAFAFSLNKPVQGPQNGWSYFNAGGNVRYSFGDPFTGNSYTGGQTLGQFGVHNSNVSALTDSLMLTLPGEFSGDLYLALNFTYGNGPVNYSIGSISRAALADDGAAVSAPAVPLPPAGILLIGALSALALRARARRD